MQQNNNLCMGCMSSLGGEQVCSVCGFDSRTYNQPGSLPLRTVLAGRYLVGKVLSKTGEGFTYLSFDSVTESVVKITEYFPEGLCSRAANGRVNIDETAAFVYNEGIIKFTQLHQTLAGLSDVSALYKIIDVFEVNNTAYCVTENPPGISFKEFLLRNGGALTWEQMRPLLMPLITAIDTLHKNGIVHGGISPDTLIVGRDGRIHIIDFCVPAVRNAESTMTAQLYPGFAAIEQYRGEEPTAASDVYAVAAVLFRTLTGNPPPDSKQRLESDNMTFSRSVAEQVPRSVLITMANALQLEPANRTKTMAEMRESLQVAEVEAPVQAKNSATAASNNSGNKKPKKSGGKKYILIAALITLLIIGLVLGVIFYLNHKNSTGDGSSSSELQTSYESYHTVSASSTPEKHLSVPDFSGSSYADLLENDEYSNWFDFKVVRKEYNNKFSRGKICAQSVKVGTAAKKGTVVELTVSLGPDKVKIPESLKGMTKEEALIAMLKRGLDFENITVVGKMGEKTTEEFIVFQTIPAMGETISPDDRITIYYNTNVVEPEVSSEPSEYYEDPYTDDTTEAEPDETFNEYLGN